MSQRELWPEPVPVPAPAPKKAKPPAAPAPEPGDDVHDPFAGIQVDLAPLAKVVLDRDPFARAIAASRKTDEASVSDDVYDRDQGEEPT